MSTDEQQRYVKAGGTRRLGPLTAKHPAVKGSQKCAACPATFVEGDFAALVLIGPGTDAAAGRLARAGREYTGVAVIAHHACVTGWES